MFCVMSSLPSFAMPLRAKDQPPRAWFPLLATPMIMGLVLILTVVVIITVVLATENLRLHGPMAVASGPFTTPPASWASA